VDTKIIKSMERGPFITLNNYQKVLRPL